MNVEKTSFFILILGRPLNTDPMAFFLFSPIIYINNIKRRKRKIRMGIQMKKKGCIEIEKKGGLGMKILLKTKRHSYHPRSVRFHLHSPPLPPTQSLKKCHFLFVPSSGVG